MRGHCAPQQSSPRRTLPHRRRATTDPAREAARLAESLRIAVMRVTSLQRQLQRQCRNLHGGQNNGGQQPTPPPPQKSRPPPPPPSSDTPASPQNARQRRSKARATQRWHKMHNSNPLEENLSPPQPTASGQPIARAFPSFAGTPATALSATVTASSRQQSVSDSTVREMPESAQLPPVSAQEPYTPEWQQQTAPIPLTLAFLVAPRRHQPAAEGKRRALEGPPGLNPPRPPIPSTLPPTAGPTIRSPHPDRSSPRPPRHHRRFTPYPAPATTPASHLVTHFDPTHADTSHPVTRLHLQPVHLRPLHRHAHLHTSQSNPSSTSRLSLRTCRHSHRPVPYTP